MKKQFLILFAFISVLALSQVPQRFNKVVVTGDITSPKFIKTGSNADSVLLGNGGARAISAIKTDTVSLSNRINAKAAGNGTANGTNTGDETLTSIKTKLGAASAVSDGYLKYQDWNTFNSKEPAFTKNSGFNKNFGTTTGTVLEGRTFGTAAGSAVGDFIQNQNASAQSANMRISGVSSSSNHTVGSSTQAGYIQFDPYADIDSRWWRIKTDFSSFGVLSIQASANGTSFSDIISFNKNGNIYGSAFYGSGANLTGVQLPITLTTNGTSGAATFSGNVLNVPNYTSSATGGTYSPTITPLSGLNPISAPFALYTNIGIVKHVALSGIVTTNKTGLCSFRFTLPSPLLENNAIFHIYVFGYTGYYIADAFVANYGLDSNVDLYFNSTSPSGAEFKYSIMVDYNY